MTTRTTNQAIGPSHDQWRHRWWHQVKKKKKQKKTKKNIKLKKKTKTKNKKKQEPALTACRLFVCLFSVFVSTVLLPLVVYPLSCKANATLPINPLLLCMVGSRCFAGLDATSSTPPSQL
jgi:hypothetical protein